MSFCYATSCLLYTSDAADEGLGVDLGGRRIIKKREPRKIVDYGYHPFLSHFLDPIGSQLDCNHSVLCNIILYSVKLLANKCWK